MSAAATAAGYLYASGRLRGKSHKDEDKQRDKGHRGHDDAPRREEAPRREIKVAVVDPQDKPAGPRKQPKIEYRTRRWKPE